MISRPVRLRLLLTVVLMAWPSYASALPTVRTGTKVVLMGDSEAYLLSWEFPRLARAAGVSFVPIVVPGSSVIQWAGQLDSQWWRIDSAKPDVILVSLGANDACTGPRVVTNEWPFMQRFKQKVTGKASCVIWLGPPSIGAVVPTKAQCSRKLAEPGLELFAGLVQRAGFPYLDGRTIFVQLWDDRLHCSRPRYPSDPSNGCRTWAEWIWNQLTNNELC